MATRDISPQANNEGSIGTALKNWASGWIKLLTVLTINKLTITQPATGATLTIAEGKTLTVSAATTLDEAVAMSSKAPKASPSFTGNVLGTSADGDFCGTNPTNTGVHYAGGDLRVTLTDNQTITFTVNASVFIIHKDTDSKGALFFIDAASATVTKLVDTGSAYEVTDTDTGKICVFKGAGSATVSVKNYTNGNVGIYVMALGVVQAATAPAP